MESNSEDISIVVFANRKDFYFTKICISSIRFYYPQVEILLVKDKINGDFNTAVLRKAFDVKLLDLGKKYYGWSSAKIHFLLNKHLPQKRYLCLDSDIIFIGRVLEKIAPVKGVFVVNAEMVQPPFTPDQIKNYFDPDQVKTVFPDYEYPGFFFNAGQTVVTPGVIDKEVLEKSFDPTRYPYFKNKQLFPTVDQSVLNAVIPVLMKKKNLLVGKAIFMHWSRSFFLQPENDDIGRFIDGDTPYMVHYCGDFRTHEIDKMKGNKLLHFFRQQYHLKLSRKQQILDPIRDRLYSSEMITGILYRQNLRVINFFNRIDKPGYY